MARKTLATTRAGTKIFAEMSAIYAHDDMSEAAVLERLKEFGHPNPQACYAWHYDNTSKNDGSLLDAPTFERAARGRKANAAVAEKPASPEVADKAPSVDLTDELMKAVESKVGPEMADEAHPAA